MLTAEDWFILALEFLLDHRTESPELVCVWTSSSSSTSECSWPDSKTAPVSIVTVEAHTHKRSWTHPLVVQLSLDALDLPGQLSDSQLHLCQLCVCSDLSVVVGGFACMDDQLKCLQQQNRKFTKTAGQKRFITQYLFLKKWGSPLTRGPPADRGRCEDLGCRQIWCLPALRAVNVNVPSEPYRRDRASWKKRRDAERRAADGCSDTAPLSQTKMATTSSYRTKVKPKYPDTLLPFCSDDVILSQERSGSGATYQVHAHKPARPIASGVQSRCFTTYHQISNKN